MQERACEQLGAPCGPTAKSQWVSAKRGPKYTLVLDCNGLRPYHFGRRSRRALTALTHVLTNYYPDFVGSTLVVNAPAFLAPMWAVVGRLMPAWWGVRIVRTVEELEGCDGEWSRRAA